MICPWFIILLHTKPNFVWQNISQVFIVLGMLNFDLLLHMETQSHSEKQNKKYWQRYPSSTNIICNFPEQFSNTISAFNFRRLIEAALFAQSIY